MEKIYLYDIHQNDFVKDSSKIKNIDELDIVKLVYNENPFYHYNWTLSFQGKNVYENSGTIQGMQENFSTFVKKFSNKEPKNLIKQIQNNPK